MGTTRVALIYALALLSPGRGWGAPFSLVSGDRVVFTRPVRAHADRDVRKKIDTNIKGVISSGAEAVVEESILFPHQRGAAVRMRGHRHSRDHDGVYDRAFRQFA